MPQTIPCKTCRTPMEVSGSFWLPVEPMNCEKCEEKESERERRDRVRAAAPQLLAALEGILGDCPSVQDGLCRYCGRSYAHVFMDGDCPSDDCPSFIARRAIAQARGEA